ncbi:hypothetical protein AYI68_g1039 [Smittium mucronatum]|uniref:Uncharacterized protein n=1 Tax=Smittium mucronatum TaxID=133383 RepID=A0A1R0H6I2_9FUNG|nr:hypothetical protein AYI68_g1039 [Smittium mucronatum]
MRKREPQFNEEDPFVTSRITFSKLSVYTELSETLPSIEENFSRTPLSEDDHKAALYSCPKTSPMSYVSPPLNDSALFAENPEIIVAEDPDIVFSNTMRFLLSDIATTVTHNRLDNLHIVMELPGRVKQIFETEIKPLMDQNAFYALLASKKTKALMSLAQPFRKRQQVAVSYEASGSNVVTEQTTAAATTPDQAVAPK